MPTCPLCAGSNPTLYARARDIEYRTLDREFDFYQCARCEILFIDPMLVDQLSIIYPPNYYSFVAGKRSLAAVVKERLDRAHFRKSLRRIDGDKLAALDVGGGTGWLLGLMQRADARVARTLVVDIDPSAKAQAEQAGHGYFLGRFEDFRADEEFDLILMLNLIEHVADPRQVLHAARRLLSPRGRVFLKTPNYDALDARLFMHKSWGGYHTPRHFVLFKRQSLTDLCRECGFEIDSFSYTQGAPFWTISALDMLSRMGVVRITPQRPAPYHPLTGLLQMGFAAFDFARKPFAKLSQMQLVLKAGSSPVT